MMEDNRIIDLYFARDKSAISETKDKYGRLLYSVSYNIVRSNEDAEECENDTYLSAWDCIPPEYPQKLCAFLTRITRNLSIKKVRYNNAQKRGGDKITLSLDEITSFVPDPADTLTERELTQILNDFLRSLPVTERRVFLCRYWYCDSVKDISRQFGFTQSKVKMMLSRTRKKLAEHLEKQEVLI